MVTDFENEYREQLLAEEKEELLARAEVIQSFIEYAKKQGVTLGSEHFRFFRTTGIVADYPGLIQLLFPDLIKDKEGLYDFRRLTNQFAIKFFANGYLFSDTSALMANIFFRRSFHPLNNWAPQFIDDFWILDEAGIQHSISLDPDRLKIDLDDQGYMEKDTWFGARFNKDIATIPDGTVKVRPPLDLKEYIIRFFFSNAYSLDISWQTKNGVKSFEAEEFKTSEVTIERNGKLYHPVRYVHAEYDLQQVCFRHFDGAIHLYTPEEYKGRIDSDMNYNQKNIHHIKTASEKMFKMNGSISLETWVEFTSQFLAGNPLVFEYFEGQYPSYILEVIEKVRKRP